MKTVNSDPNKCESMVLHEIQADVFEQTLDQLMEEKSITGY